MKRSRTLRTSLPGLRQLVLFFLPRLGTHRRLVIVSVAALGAEVVLGTLEPWPVKFIFDRVLGVHRHGRPSLLPDLARVDASTIIVVSALAIVVISGLRALAEYASTIGFARVANRVLADLRADLYRHLQGLSLSFHHRARGGDLLLRLLNDVNQLRDVAVTAVLPLVADVLVLCALVGVMFWLHWKLAMLGLVTLPLFWLWTVRLTGRIQQAARSQRQRESAMAATAAETIGAIKVIQALCLERRFAGSFLTRNRESEREDVKTTRLTAALGRSVAFLAATSTAIVLWQGARLVLRQELTPGELLVFMTYLKNAFRPVRDLAKYTGRLVKATAAGERVIHLLEQYPEIRDLPGSVPAPPFRGAVEFERVDFEYEGSRRTLSQISFTVDPGQHVALVGPSGMGKSTIASLILRLYDPTRGLVRIDGRDIREYTVESLRGQIGVVLQDTLLFALTIKQNIALGAAEAAPLEIESAARLANAHEFIQSLPEGYDTLVGERGATLSGGQRQRIAIARAAIRNARLLVLDEPTTGLDEESEQAVLDALKKLTRGRTTFWITHDLQLAARADLILFVEDGRLIEGGTHEELMMGRGRYAALFRMQKRGRPGGRFSAAAFENSELATLPRS
jgi:ATP-binding cassette subfamily B protein